LLAASPIPIGVESRNKTKVGVDPTPTYRIFVVTKILLLESFGVIAELIRKTVFEVVGVPVCEDIVVAIVSVLTA
jgi:hypothetical protein